MGSRRPHDVWSATYGLVISVRRDWECPSFFVQRVPRNLMKILDLDSVGFSLVVRNGKSRSERSVLPTRRYESNRFGCFVHWTVGWRALYSSKEQFRENERGNQRVYARLARKWLEMKYAVSTKVHWDLLTEVFGWCLRATDFNDWVVFWVMVLANFHYIIFEIKIASAKYMSE